jgi:hypothetical protein
MSSLARCEINFDATDIEVALGALPRRLNDDVSIIFDLNAAWGEAWMKMNAPWTDNTGAARSGLTAIADSQGSLHTLLLSYSVSYGIWLEVANSGRFQILGPAQRIIANKIMQDLAGLLEGRPPDTRAPTLDIEPIARKAKPVTNKSGNRSSRKKYGQRQQGQ